MISQRTWRATGLITLGLCAVMAWYGSEPGVTSLEPGFLIIYWLVFGLSFLISLYMAFLDMRYIRLQYKLGEKELFEDTLGSEDFRTALRGERERDGDRADSNKHS